MRYRTKLLLLLCLTALIPAVLLPVWGGVVSEHMGAVILSRVEAGLAESGRRNLALAAAELAEVMALGSRLVRLAAMRQAEAVGGLLSGGRERAGWEDEVAAEPPAELPAERYTRPRMGGGREPLAVDFSRVGLFDLAPGGRPPEGLKRLAGFWRPMFEDSWDTFQWFFVITPGGGVALYPAPGELPEGYDPRREEWYRRAEESAAGWDGRGSPRLIWTVHQADVFTGDNVAVVAMPIVGPDGKLAAVTGMALPLSPVLAREPIIGQLPASSLIFMVVPEIDPAGAPGLYVIEAVVGDGAGDALAGPARAVRWLSAGDGASVAGVVGALTDGGRGMAELPFAGQPCLWVYESQGRGQVGFVVVTPLAALAEPVAQAEAFMKGVQQRRDRIMAVAWLAVVLVTVGLALFFARRATLRLSALSRAMQRLARGDFAVRVADMGRDEFGDMGRTFNEMVPELRQFTLTRQELAVAREVQEGLLPAAAPEVPGLEVAGLCQFSAETGGDYYDFLAGGDGRLTVVVGDVSGHGLSAALLMTAFRAFFRLRADLSEDLAGLATDVNQHLCQDTYASGRFVTAFIARFEPGPGLVFFVRAGHDPALVYDPAADSFGELMGQGLAMGVDGSFAYASSAAQLSPGQVVAIGTDGIWEAVDPAGAMYGKERFKAVIRAGAALSAAGICRAVSEDLAAFRGTQPQEDDVTLVVVKVI
jgi:sigma-B regulation protein RsbU (phosphoserine phosphatase)